MPLVYLDSRLGTVCMCILLQKHEDVLQLSQFVCLYVHPTLCKQKV